MPRVKMAGDCYLDKDLAELIRRYKYGKGLNNAEAGRLVGIGERTFARYLEKPGMVPLSVLRMMQRRLQIPKEEFLKCLL
jgi:hypothetical protein